MSEQERAESQTTATVTVRGATDSDREAVAREIGAQLKEGREAQRLSLEDVSARLKVSPSKLVAIENVLESYGILEIARTGRISLERASGVNTAYLKVTSLDKRVPA